MASVFITGATGYMGQRLATALLARGHTVRALARPSSAHRLPPGCNPIQGNALDATTYRDSIPGCDTLVHLVGVPHPSPSKAQEFRTIDLTSAREAIAAATHARVQHFVYVSVAHPAPIMKEYIAARTEAEAAIRASGLNATILRPWYVLGPGHRWPYALIPLYFLLRTLPATRDSANRLGLVTLPQMVRALVQAVEHPSTAVTVLEVPQIRTA